MPYWRQAGLNYIKYSQICARIVRQALKGDAKLDGEKRSLGIIKPTLWKDGKPLTRSSFLSKYPSWK
ncbi:hypothetical protein LSH36_326g04195 [Paralvinella palmiformis]|uniref:Uncharacterized protein n=1 Tax=Paralvinella palmiformis TaxID=53620 RepID=A0AAD9JHZ6_9ANNE|nr:hypothetical protein LSH36_326g04195 [Paralvinella palmiformis]